MVEATVTWDFVPGADMNAYEALAKQGVQQVLAAPGIVEFRANRNLLGSPQVRATYVFETMVDFARFWESPEPRALESELRRFVTNLQVTAWGSSPVMPEPLRPSN